jgi:hypothetical protein
MVSHQANVVVQSYDEAADTFAVEIHHCWGGAEPIDAFPAMPAATMGVLLRQWGPPEMFTGRTFAIWF